MVVFERYPETVLQELSRVVLYDTHLANTTCKNHSLPPSPLPSFPLLPQSLESQIPLSLIHCHTMLQRR